ncbi:MAG: tripartite tricarboxylate transporter TctB family protein [Spirochaetales bacterium]
MTEKSMTKADFVTSIVLLAFGITVVVKSVQMPTMADANQSKFSAPGIVPGFIGVMVTLLSFAMLIRSIKRKGMQEIVQKGAAKDLLAQETTSRILKTLVICVVYVLLLGKLWFPLPTALFIFAFIVMFEYDFKSAFRPQIKKIIVAFIIAVVATTLVTVVFQYLFLVNLP